MVLSFLLFMGIFTIIGISSSFKSRGTKQDYYLASGTVSPFFVGLSAVATNNSGYMFIGMIGYTYSTGLSSIWLMVGWILGDFMASLFIHSRLKKATIRTGDVSFAGVLSNWNKSMPYLQKTIAIITLIFLLAYASAQLVAGSKALMVLFQWPSWGGALIGAALVLLYCLAGGIRASIWTDVAQSFVMVFAMGLLLVTAFYKMGGLSVSLEKLSNINGFMTIFPKSDVLAIPGLAGGLLFAVAWAFAGFSVIGQPHIMVRFMTLESDKKMVQARTWYYLWFVLFYAMAIGVGLLSRLYFFNPADFPDPELALPKMAQSLLSPWMAGIILAGIFAATMSTADSVILSCSSCLTHDLIPHKMEKNWMIKSGTVVVTLIALSWAIGGIILEKDSVFTLVLFSWSGLGSAFAPLLLMLSLKKKPNEIVAIFSVLIGLSVAVGWRLLGWQSWLYEGMPAIIISLLFLIFVPIVIKHINSVRTKHNS